MNYFACYQVFNDSHTQGPHYDHHETRKLTKLSKFRCPLPLTGLWKFNIKKKHTSSLQRNDSVDS